MGAPLRWTPLLVVALGLAMAVIFVAAVTAINLESPFFAGVMAACSLVVALAALLLAFAAFDRGNKNSSVASFITLTESFRSAWRRYQAAQTAQEKESEFHDIMNLFELACAIDKERSLVGVSREILRIYLMDVLELFESNSAICAAIRRMRHSDTVFAYLRQFVGSDAISSKFPNLKAALT